MNFESLRQYLLGKPGASEEFPFGPSAMVFKVINPPVQRSSKFLDFS
jgi:predicted DNA-binding protein (MmcQ/YjbR family)